jgi:hypothetical protein
MARGFESKSVADQQEAAQAGPAARDEALGDPARLGRLHVLQLSRADVLRRLETARAPAHRETLQRALAALDAEISRLG